ncbi:MAG: hypothetical protein WBB21_09675 [Saprospiraceae bacterium]
MKPISSNKVLFILMLLTTIFCCKKDDDPVHVNPGLSFVSGSGLITSDVSIPIYSPIKISIAAAKGSNSLKSITVKQDGLTLQPLTFKENATAAPANPALLIGTDKDGITNIYEFNTSKKPDTTVYEFTLADEKDSLEVRTIRVIFTAIPATETAKGLIIYNFSGPRQGGLDLFNAKVVSGNDPNAHVRDYGVVDPQSNFDWVKKFTPRNGSIIKNPPSSFTYSGILYQEDIIDAFDNGSNEVGSIDTKVLAKGDVFVVKNGTSYFAVSIDNLNFTANDNLDNYQVSIMR